MSNHSQIYDYIKENPKSLSSEFGYRDVHSIATRILTSTGPGKAYATLKFLQNYCALVTTGISSGPDFFNGDPRKFEKLKNVKSEWNFKLTNKENLNTTAVKRASKIKPGKLNMSKPETSEVNYSDFVVYLTNELSRFTEKSYTWKYSIRDRVDWLNDDLRKGETLLQAQKALTSAGAILKYALDNNNQQLCFESVRSIMDWGGVYYPQGPRHGNKDNVEALHEKNILLENIACNYQKFRIEKVDKITLMNAGWTKVWSVLFPDQFVMFDSRVSFAFTKFLAAYCQDKGKTKGYFSFPSELGYRQIRQGKRDVQGFRNINNDPIYWSQSMLITSHILKSCLGYAKVKGVDISRYEPNSLRSVEARLFMMGE